MVLSKRKRDGEFVAWTPAEQMPSQPVVPDIPPAKKSRAQAKASSTSLLSASSSKVSMQPLRTASYDTPEVSYLSPGAETPPTGSYGAPYTAQSSSQAGPSQPQETVKSRKKADPNAPKPEKRGAIFKKSCPKNILDRVERVMSQRFFMIDRQRMPGELKETFSVLGSTGNVYTVTIDRTPRCNCPDALKGNHCKHILFIYLKVLQVTQDSGLWYQKGLLTSELETIFADAPDAPNLMANSRIREAHARATDKAFTTTAQTPGKKRILGPDDDCPICYEGMHNADETSLNFCDECGNALHKQCFDQYYHGPRRGQRYYGYPDYLD
ncbi:hypothetical protein C0991_000279 [Blastosporella zonata]|nr:hypothetical protein C0991_000279 [Blastosporella zonata]